MLERKIVGLFTKAFNKSDAIQKRVADIRNNEEGATAVEYALIIGVVALVIVVGFSELGQAILTRIREFVAQIG